MVGISNLSLFSAARVPIRRMMHHMAEEHEREDFVHANASTYRWEQGVDSYLYEASEKPLHRMCN